MSSCRNQFRHFTRAFPRTPSPRQVRALAGLVTLACSVTGAAACGGKDPLAVNAAYNTLGTSFVLYPQSRVRAPYFSALELRTPTRVQPGVTAVSSNGVVVLAPNFDVAFDLDSAGKIVLLQAKQLVSAQFVPRTGFQTSTTAFDSLGAAPGGTYQLDSIVRVSVGQTFIVQAQGTTGCTVTAPFYAKLVVDSVSPATGAMYIRARIDPNCGFRSFAAGLPTS